MPSPTPSHSSIIDPSIEPIQDNGICGAQCAVMHLSFQGNNGAIPQIAYITDPRVTQTQ